MIMYILMFFPYLVCEAGPPSAVLLLSDYLSFLNMVPHSQIYDYTLFYTIVFHKPSVIETTKWQPSAYSGRSFILIDKVEKQVV